MGGSTAPSTTAGIDSGARRDSAVSIGLDSLNWRNKAGDPTPVSSSSNTTTTTAKVGFLAAVPELGTIVRLPPGPEQLVPGSILHSEWSEAQRTESAASRWGSPWRHPQLVIKVHGDIITVLQLTSRDIVAGSKKNSTTPNLGWASRYMPVSHNGDVSHHPDCSMGRLELMTGPQMEKASSVNIETELRCELSDLRSFNRACAPRLTNKAFQVLLHQREGWQAGSRHQSHGQSLTCPGPGPLPSQGQSFSAPQSGLPPSLPSSNLAPGGCWRRQTPSASPSLPVLTTDAGAWPAVASWRERAEETAKKASTAPATAGQSGKVIFRRTPQSWTPHQKPRVNVHAFSTCLMQHLET